MRFDGFDADVFGPGVAERLAPPSPQDVALRALSDRFGAIPGVTDASPYFKAGKAPVQAVWIFNVRVPGGRHTAAFVWTDGDPKAMARQVRAALVAPSKLPSHVVMLQDWPIFVGSPRGIFESPGTSARAAERRRLENPVSSSERRYSLRATGGGHVVVEETDLDERALALAEANLRTRNDVGAYTVYGRGRPTTWSNMGGAWVESSTRRYGDSFREHHSVLREHSSAQDVATRPLAPAAPPAALSKREQLRRFMETGRKENPIPRLPSGIGARSQSAWTSPLDYLDAARANGAVLIAWYTSQRSAGGGRSNIALQTRGGVAQRIVHQVIKAGGSVEAHEVEWPGAQHGYSMYLVLTPRAVAEAIVRRSGLVDDGGRYWRSPDEDPEWVWRSVEELSQ